MINQWPEIIAILSSRSSSHTNIIRKYNQNSQPDEFEIGGKNAPKHRKHVLTKPKWLKYAIEAKTDR